MGLTTEQIEAIAAKLREIPPAEKNREPSKQEAVRMLSKEIVALQKRGYTLQQISAMLRGEGLSIATPTLKSYMQRAKPASKAKENKRRQTDTPAAPPAAAMNPAGTSKATFTPKPDSDEI